MKTIHLIKRSFLSPNRGSGMIMLSFIVLAILITPVNTSSDYYRMTFPFNSAYLLVVISGICYFLRWRRKHWGTFLLLFLLPNERISATNEQAIAYWTH